jgi:hypothetical protein
VHAYCLMSNHFHLVVETPQPNLVAGMKWLLGTYPAALTVATGNSAMCFPGVTNSSSSMAAVMAISRAFAITCTSIQLGGRGFRRASESPRLEESGEMQHNEEGNHIGRDEHQG